MNLDNVKKIYKMDPGLMAESIGMLPEQISQVLEDSHLVRIPESYSRIDKVVINGMGGSNLGARILQSCYLNKMKVPVEVVPGYAVPNYVDKKTLYIISSYSGNTEEPLSVYEEVKKRGARVLGITSSHKKNKLEKLMMEENIPGFVFSPLHNPSEQPRIGLGYSIFGFLTLLDKVGVIDLEKKKVERIIKRLRDNNSSLRPEAKTGENKAKEIAQGLKGRIPIIIGAEFLEGNLHTLRNQFCENSKNFADYLSLPELNHYLLESLANPISNKKNLAFLFIDSDKYHPRVQRRSELSKEVARKNGAKVLQYQVKEFSRLGQCAQVLQFGSWVSFYLGILNNVNPAQIPWVDWFKKELK